MKRERLVEILAGDLLDEIDVADAFAEAAHHGGDLGVEHGRGHDAGLGEDDLDVLAGGVEHLDRRGVGHQRPERREIDALGHRIDDRLGAGSGELHEAQLRPERLLAHELGIDGHIGALGQLAAGRFEIRCRGDDAHKGSHDNNCRTFLAGAIENTAKPRALRRSY